MTAEPDPQATRIRLDDGREFTLRPLRTDDVEALRRAFLRLTPEEVEYRFFYRSRELPVSVQAQVRALDPILDAAFVLDDAGEIRAVADFHLSNPQAREAEFGLIVGKAIAGRGLGTLLLQRLLAEARARGLGLCGLVRSDNARMLELCHSLGATTGSDGADPGVRVVRFAP